LQANVTLLEELRRRRHELAITQGFPSFAHRTLSDRMVQTPETVRAFLQRAVAANQLPFRKDMGEIAFAKKAVEKTSDPVEAWDVSFYEHLLEARESEDVQAKIASYLTLPKTLEALQNLMHQLFGIAMTEYPMDRTERWDLSSTDNDRTEATKLRKFLFSHEEQGQLGTLYLDLHPRESKYGHPAHYTAAAVSGSRASRCTRANINCPLWHSSAISRPGLVQSLMGR
jgi:mitochondrial intermediate peptidase